MKIEICQSKANDPNCVHALKIIIIIIINNTFRAKSSLPPPPVYLEFTGCSMFLLCVIRKRKCSKTAPLQRKALSVLHWQTSASVGRFPSV